MSTSSVCHIITGTTSWPPDRVKAPPNVVKMHVMWRFIPICCCTCYYFIPSSFTKNPTWQTCGDITALNKGFHGWIVRISVRIWSILRSLSLQSFLRPFILPLHAICRLWVTDTPGCASAFPFSLSDKASITSPDCHGLLWRHEPQPDPRGGGHGSGRWASTL